ncbi:MAG: DNA polymerase III subunit beta [candidate division WOR-3 bacterium]
MEFKINTERFENMLNSIVKLIPPKSTHTVLQNVILDVKNNNLSIEGTDLDVFVKKTIACEAKKEGKALLPGKKLLEITHEANTDELSFKLKELSFQINAGKAEFNIPALDYQEFPETPKYPAKKWLKISIGEINEMIDSAIFMVSKDLSRRAMNGVLVQLKDGILNVVTTDGARLALCRKEQTGDPYELIVPPKVFDLLDIAKKEETLEISVEERMIGLRYADTTIIARLIEGPYPNYEAVVPRAFSGTCTIEKNVLEGALKRVSLVSSPTTKSVKFDFSKEDILLSAASPDFGEAKETVPCIYEGEKMTIWYNAGFILETLRHIHSADITFQLTSPTTASLLKPKEEGMNIYLLMPLRIDSYE